jgi:hypothetical protein
MKNNNNYISIAVFVVVFLVVFGIFQLVNMNKDKYSCFDYENNVTYTFKTEEDMHEVCDKLNGVADDNVMNSYSIYDELINTDDSNGFSFDPYVLDDELVIIVAITDCDNPELAKERARQWFKDHSYNINDFKIEYENPCGN